MKERNLRTSPTHIFLSIILPVIVTFIMFIVALFALILPSYKKSIEERKIETVREITNAAWSILAHYSVMEENGTLQPAEARQNAINELRTFRYGPSMKDYVWILDMQPVMIMHPYRDDLEGKSLKDFADPEGTHLFVEMVDIVKKSDQGLLQYMWQWKDDPEKIMPKLSFVKEFKPWGWIIGSGMYIDDVEAEIAAMSNRIYLIATVIVLSVGILLSIVIFQTLKIEHSRVQIERAHYMGEKKYWDLTEMLPVLVYEMNLDGNMTFLNQYAFDMLGYERIENVQQFNVISFIHPDDHKRLKENLARLLNGEIVGLKEYRMIKRDGSILNVLVRSYPLRQDDRITGLRGVIVDITEKIKAEEELRKSEEKYRELVQNANSIILRVDMNGNITFFNEYAEKFFGYRQDEIIGKNLVGTIVPETDSNGSDLRGLVADIIKHPGDNDSIENENVCKNGKRVWVNWANKVILDKDGSHREILSIGNDITERMLAEKARQHSEARMNSIFRASPIGIGLVENRVIFSVNDQVCKMLGYKPEELLNRDSRILYPDEKTYESVGNIIYKQIDDTGTGSHETKWKRKDGRLIDVQINCSPLDPLKNTGNITFIVMDITERKKLEKQFLQAQKMETVGRLAGGVAHDFNNLLTVISGNADLALFGLPRNSQEFDFVSEIKRTSERAANLTRQLLAFSRQQVVKPTCINLNDIINGMEKMLRRLIGEHIELETITAPNLWSVKADPGQMEQVLTNLVVNSHDAMPEGGTLTIETSNKYLDAKFAREHISVTPGEYVMLSVTDTGIGMDEDVVNHIFDPFFTTKESGKGTGLGMSTCYGIVNQSGGTIWIYSELGKGTTIKVFLPRKEDSTDSLKDESKEETIVQGSGTILVAEDEPGVRKLVKSVLVRNGYTVLMTESVDEALLIARKKKPGTIDMLLTDVVMPKKNGRELAEEVNSLHPDIKVIYMSGYTPDSIANYHIFNKDVILLQKPFTPHQLLENIHATFNA